MNPRELVKKPLFWIGLILRLGLLGVSGSTYLMDHFIPFLDRSIQNWGVNPWTLSSPADFPYGSVLYLLLVLPKKIAFELFGSAALGSNVLSLVLIKSVLLVFDLALLYLLIRFFKDRSYRALIYYWLNPILIYISYIHGQLDVVAMTFVFYSLAFLARDNWIKSALVFVCALLCKFHVIILVPVILFYIWNTQFMKQAISRISQWVGIFLVLSLLGMLPNFQAQTAQYISLGSPEALRIFALKFDWGGPAFLSVGLLALGLIFLRIFLATKISRSGIFHACGALMACLVFVTYPMPGWFFWFLPFLSFLYIEYQNTPKTLLLALIAFYFFYFVALGYVQTPAIFQSLFLTGLQTLVLAWVVWWVLVIFPRTLPRLDRLRAFTIGIGGDSGAGKNFLCKVIQNLLSVQQTQIVEGDDYHRWERGAQQWSQVTHLDPSANRIGDMFSHIKQLRNGQSVWWPHYDHSTGKFTQEREIKPEKTLILQGLHTLFSSAYQNLFDLRIFLNPDPLVRTFWKLQRDILQRGYDPEVVFQSLERRRSDSENYIQPQKNNADWVIEFKSDFQGDKKALVELVKSGKDLPLYMEYQLKITPGLLDFVTELSKHFQGLQIRRSEQLEHLIVRFDENPTEEKVALAAKEIFANLRQITRSNFPPVWNSGFAGYHQLFLCYKMNIIRGEA